MSSMAEEKKKEPGNFIHVSSPIPDESLGLLVLGYILLAFNIAVRAYCGVFMIISDCDETFNYWEPLNLIYRGFGKQTWEYSPEYAIRSYAYLIPYYLITFPVRDLVHLTKIQLEPDVYFFFIRIFALSGFTAFTEYRLFGSTRRNFGYCTANWFLLFSTVSTGMSHAGVALLPSSFAMNWITLGVSYSLDALTWTNTNSCIAPSTSGIFCFLIAGLVGWPFALVLGVPFGLFTIFARLQTWQFAQIVINSFVLLSLLVGALMCIDSYFYDRNMLFVPMNIVLYNVFSGEGEGPEIFGVEPLSYYVKNLFLNFNVIFIAGYLGLIANPIVAKCKSKVTIGVSAPLLIWTAVFFSQPHKEERFLYPIYPLITLSASIFTSRTFRILKMLKGGTWLVRITLSIFVFSVTVVSLLRVFNLVENYSAPITTSVAFSKQLSFHETNEIQNVCIGREWYHFPTSLVLPDNCRLRFVASGFDGLLPGDFPENVTLKEAASSIPKGMNSRNLFSPEKLIDFDDCHYYIDNTSPVNQEIGEVQIVAKSEDGHQVNDSWEVITCQKMINPSGNHSGLGRFIYIPKMLRRFIPYNVEYMDYCVLRKRK